MCPDHAGRPLELYCEACRMLLCMECKVYGSHALGVNRDHRVLRLSEAAGTIRQQLRDVRWRFEARGRKVDTIR